MPVHFRIGKVTLFTGATAILLLAFFLRTFRLGAQSLWYDEAYSVFYARAGVAAVLGQQQADPLPYYLLLAGWVRLAGVSEYAVRFLSVALGTLTLPVVYQAVRATGATRARQLALAAMGALAVSAFHVYYSQEARLHVLAGLMAALTVYAAVQAARRDTPLRWGAYAGAAAAGMYCYYYLALLVVGLNLALIPSHWRSRRWRRANGAAAVAALPGFALAYQRVSGFGEPYLLAASPTPLQLLAQAPSYLFLGPTRPPAWAFVVTALVLLLSSASAIAILRRPARFGGMLLGGVLVAGAGVYALTAVLHVFFHLRYEIVALPALLALLVLGCRASQPRVRWLWPAGGAVVLAATGVALFDGYAVPGYQRDDNRGALSLVRAEALPDEILAYDLPLQYDVLDYYGRDLGLPAQPLPVPRNANLPRDRQFGPDTGDRAATEARLSQLAGQYAGFWLLLSGDPAHWTEDWLDANRLPVLNQWFGGTRLKHYRPLPADGPARLPDGQRVEQAFGPLRLRQVQTPPLTPGKPWPVRLAWEAASPPAADYTVSLQLFDQQGRRLAQQDQQPFGGVLPTSGWQPGKAYEDVAYVPLPAAMGPGIYRLDAAVYDGQAATSHTVAKAAAGLAPQALSPARADAGWTVEHVALAGTPAAGYALAVEGSVQARPGVDVTWFAHLLGPAGQLLSQDDHPPLARTSAWQPGDRFAEAFILPPAAGAASLEIGAYDASGKRVDSVVDGVSRDHLALPVR